MHNNVCRNDYKLQLNMLNDMFCCVCIDNRINWNRHSDYGIIKNHIINMFKSSITHRYVTR